MADGPPPLPDHRVGSRVSTEDETYFGSDLIDEYDELEEIYQDAGDVDAELTSLNGELVVAAAESTPRSGTDRAPQWFSARAAEAVQNDEPVDERALFDVSFQSPSIRKTVDHTKSRPVLRAAASPMSYDNPRLQPGRTIGMPPASPAPRALLSRPDLKRTR
ncbi:uncharacterized protein V1510DRAFT_414716 [Dipodascopsis tothii]|uniref:uncharacterized protein n=1 Tax=Dipodascopsis tothii TaxID=44089 RepID=UPI0034CE2602